MVMKSATISAARFKAECLGLLDQVARTGRTLVITKRGRAVARLVPLEATPRSLHGSVLAEDDIVSPTGAAWNAI
ncbi:MAG: type II toxin-antitoxin system Phd/YefM family antitoxin [Archangiaceae bacterium]|nr:type II toxin-antitoxin system Phd/YefM family antitoxin [Archangiaceae bacterium]